MHLVHAVDARAWSRSLALLRITVGKLAVGRGVGASASNLGGKVSVAVFALLSGRPMPRSPFGSQEPRCRGVVRVAQRDYALSTAYGRRRAHGVLLVSAHGATGCPVLVRP